MWTEKIQPVNYTKSLGERERDRERERQTERERDRERERQRERDRDTDQQKKLAEGQKQTDMKMGGMSETHKSEEEQKNEKKMERKFLSNLAS